MKELPTHDTLPVETTWDLTAVYQNESAWERDFKKITPLVKKMQTFRTHLSESPETLADAFKTEDELSLLLEKLHSYAHMKSDEDTGNSANRGRVDRVLSKSAEIEGDTAWFEPEIMAMPLETFRKFKNAPALKFYRTTMKRLEADRPHTLSAPEERILGMASEVFSVPYKAFSVLNDADLVFPMVHDDSGSEIRLTHGNYSTLLESPKREVRKEAFKGIYHVYSQFRNTFAALLDGEVRSHVMDAKLRKFKSALSSALHPDAVPESVYTSLIDSVHHNFAPLHDYFKLRAEHLKLDRLDMFDIHCPLLPDHAVHFEWAEAQPLMTDALAPLGPDYGNVLRKAFDERWIDVFECKGKRSGAYSGGCYGCPPYLLLNFNGNLDSMFTLAHELGHSMHTHYSNTANAYHYAGYKIFVAEVASTTNEILLQKYLVSRAGNKQEKAYLLNHLIDTIRGTLYRQTMFAEFERDIHASAEQGEPLTADALSERYFAMNAAYHGDGVNPDSDIRFEWARIPHFHYDFYVYKYATGISAALALSKQILAGETEGYFRFLKAGDTKDVIDIMKDAGVDFTTPRPVDEALSVFAETVKELRECLK